MHIHIIGVLKHLVYVGIDMRGILKGYVASNTALHCGLHKGGQPEFEETSKSLANKRTGAVVW